MAALASVQVLVSGRVQGVGFRFFAQAKARAYGLEGYVRNLPDGRVEVVAAGERTALEGLVAELRRGPSASQVRGCQIQWLDKAGPFSGFSITY